MIQGARKKRTQKDVRDFSLDIWINHQTPFSLARRRESRPALEGVKDGRVVSISEDALLSVFTGFEVVTIMRFWVAGEDLVVDEAVGRVGPATEGAGVDVRS